MSSPDHQVHPLAEILHAIFADLIENGTASIVEDGDNDAVEVQTDEWTLILEGWPISQALIAVDAATDSDEEHRQALGAAVKPRELEVIAATNAHLNGAIAQGLNDSKDGMSRVLAEMLESFD